MSFLDNPSAKQQTGSQGETAALEFLQRQGYTLMERNFSTKFGEIDLIMQNGEELVFVEVKKRSTDQFGHPSLAVNHKKLSNMKKAARIFMEQKRLYQPFRFDIISILPHENIEHFENISLFR